MTEDLNELIIQYRAALAMEAEKQEAHAAAASVYMHAGNAHEDARELSMRLGRQLLEMIGAGALQPVADTDAQAAIAEPVAAEKHGIDKETDASTAALAEAIKTRDAFEAAMANGAPSEERVSPKDATDEATKRYLDALVAGPVDELADDVLKAATPVDQPEPAFSAAEPPEHAAAIDADTVAAVDAWGYFYQAPIRLVANPDGGKPVTLVLDPEPTEAEAEASLLAAVALQQAVQTEHGIVGPKSGATQWLDKHDELLNRSQAARDVYIAATMEDADPATEAAALNAYFEATAREAAHGATPIPMGAVTKAEREVDA